MKWNMDKNVAEIVRKYSIQAAREDVRRKWRTKS